jgi:hypothetical protein
MPQLHQQSFGSRFNIGLLASQGAGLAVFMFRWTASDMVAIIRSLRLGFLQSAAAAALVNARFDAYIARGYTVAETGGTTPTLGGNQAKRRTSAGPSRMATNDVRLSNAITGLTGGTKTLDASPILSLPVNLLATTPNANVQSDGKVFSESDGILPIVLAQNEGLVVVGPSTAFDASAAGLLMVDVAWSETASY